MRRRIPIKIELKNIQEIRHDRDNDEVVVEYTSSLDRSKEPVRFEVKDEEKARELINEISEAHRDYLEDPKEDHIILDI